jgi:hypothetical protein
MRSTPFVATVGWEVVGDMYPTTTCDSNGICNWNIAVWAGGNGSILNVTPMQKMIRAYKGVLEVYELNTCNQLPTSDGMMFWKFALTQPMWGGPDQYVDIGHINELWHPSIDAGGPSCTWGNRESASFRNYQVWIH